MVGNKKHVRGNCDDFGGQRHSEKARLAAEPSATVGASVVLAAASGFVSAYDM